MITLWYFLFQRLLWDHTLSKALSDAVSGGADALSPPGKPLSAALRSQATTAISDARQRLPLALIRQTLSYTASQIRSWAQNLQWMGWNVILLDGSTLRLRPFGDIPAHFPAHGGGGHKKSYWCLMRVVVSFCLTTGVVLASTFGATHVSEQVLAAQLMLQAMPGSLFVGDRNFGIFSVVFAACAAQGKILVRLTGPRAARLAKEAGQQLRVGLDMALLWKPSRWDQCSPGQSFHPVEGRLIVVRVHRPGFRSLVLYLFTTLTDAHLYLASELVQLYGARWLVELNLRFVKSQMDLGALDCKSAAMAQKEWLAGLVAYNLIRSVMVAAAARARLPITALSFSRTRQLFQDWLVRRTGNPRDDLASWERLLANVVKCRHPRRRKPRPCEPRALRRFNPTFPNLLGDRSLARKKLKISNAKN